MNKQHRGCSDTQLFTSNESAEQPYTVVLGKGMLRNNTLLPALMRQPVLRWYPWHRLIKSGQLSVKSKKETDNPLSGKPTSVAGWGKKKSFKRAKKLASKINRPVISVEDGFLRSITSGINSRYGCSIVVDDVGIYFDSAAPSKLEKDIIARLYDWNEDCHNRAQQAIKQILDYKLSKYNSILECPSLSDNLGGISQPNHQFEHVLVVDQVKGDASIKGAGANHAQFKAMLKKACSNHPNSHIWIKAHPASELGYLNDFGLIKKLSKDDQRRISILKDSVNPISLLEQVDHVYTVSSHMGFEALMLGKTVHCFGVSWYAGWGLTDDSYAPKKLLKKVTSRREQLLKSIGSTQDEHEAGANEYKNLISKLDVLQLFYASYIDYSRYADPATGCSCELEQTIEWLITNRYWYLKLPSKLNVIELSRWKIGFVSQFLQLINSNDNASIKIKPKSRFPLLRAIKRLRIEPNYDILIWGLANIHRLKEEIKRTKAQNISELSKRRIDRSAGSTTIENHNINTPNIWCMEDGFIRSNGLGATLLEPLSVVIDGRGIYYDATQTSDLEVLIAQSPVLSQSQLDRVHRLHKTLLTKRVSKYHVGQPAKITIPSKAKHNKSTIILVVGQVEDDLSVQYCGSLIKTNSSLIERVRKDNPNAYLIFKPHPDVEAKLRAGAVNSKMLKLVDYVAHDVAMPDCLDIVDEVHTISSLTGFEALLRHKTVTCYGLPFYAGWGLTQDKDATLDPKSKYLKRRQQRRYEFLKEQENTQHNNQSHISLEQLIFCTLIKYPMYRLPGGYGLAQVEQVIDYLYDNDADKSDLSNMHVNSEQKRSTYDNRVCNSVLSESNLGSVVSKLGINNRYTQRIASKNYQYTDKHQLQKAKTKFMQMRYFVLKTLLKK